MKWLLFILFILIILFIIIICTKLKITLHYFHQGKTHQLHIQFRIWRFIKYKVEIPLVELNQDKLALKITEKTSASGGGMSEEKMEEFTAKDLLNSLYNTRELLSHVASFYHIARHFMSKITIQQLRWHTVFGVGDAAITGMLTGAFWAVKGSFLGIISHYMRLKTAPQLSVSPQFQFAVSHTSFLCIFHFRIGHAMLAGIKLIKFWKNGKAHFKSASLPVLSDDKSKTY
ncbi:DUF2953 domain-containing protein [Cytobacillus purgationiresistens]|uniref:DUF2953 domain-containing protein n=1 Tax=Cytobacillus purgationiresistens TaxID=863449 RepID=A0ABU0APZ1_9BACI|nr:DUF2953 domain-containing protein [Cytobacillus purgationiresistens]MDQ0272105.1 hypothetical protein [Cytobacillus purgationiresistens]